MNFSVNKNDKSKPIKKIFTEKQKRGFAIFGAVVVSIIGISYASAAIDQSNLERDNVKIIISDIDDNISVGYPTNSRKIKAKLSGISQLAKAKIADNSVNVNEYKDYSGIIEYEIRNIAEGENTINLLVQDGKRQANKTIKIRRQTKADYDKQELEKATATAEEAIKKAESDPTDENIAAAKSNIEKLPKLPKLPEDKRQLFNERIIKLEKAKQDEKERQEREELAKRAIKEQEQQIKERTPPIVAPTQEPQNRPIPSRPSSNRPTQSANLPLKAICKDGTIQYQDSPDLSNYRGMCSGHGGIAKKLGRIP